MFTFSRFRSWLMTFQLVQMCTHLYLNFVMVSVGYLSNFTIRAAVSKTISVHMYIVLEIVAYALTTQARTYRADKPFT